MKVYWKVYCKNALGLEPVKNGDKEAEFEKPEDASDFVIGLKEKYPNRRMGGMFNCDYIYQKIERES